MAKRQMLEHVNRATHAGMDVDVLTLGCARRATAYKRMDLLFQDIERLHSSPHTPGGYRLSTPASPPRTSRARSSFSIFMRSKTSSKTTSRLPTWPTTTWLWGPH